MTTGPDSGAFDDLPPLDDEWVNKAARREETAQERADRLARIKAKHERLQREQEQERKVALNQTNRDKWRPWIIGGSIVAVLILVLVVL